jgi:hypothetical protein
MSYPYRVVVTKGVEEAVIASDRSRRTVELPPIVDSEATQGFFEAALRKRGWQGEGGTLTKTGSHGERLEVELETGVVTTTLEGEAVIKKEISREGVGDSDYVSKEELQQKVEKRVEELLVISEAEREAKRAGLEERLAERLRAGEEEREKELSEVLLEVYAESLKKKAQGLGTVTEVREEVDRETGEYELVIRIEE